MIDDPLLTTLDQRLIALRGGALHLGFSGGGDSTALLHALASLPRARERGLVAIHVDHGLHPDSSAWTERCAAFCARLAVPLRIEPVQVTLIEELGVEAAARRARHAALARCLARDDVLVLAHHQDDQAETLLLRLLHGAGQEGLAGMRALRAFDPGWLWRPWLDVPRAWLSAYRERHGLEAIEDSANADPQFARTHLRHRVLPAMTQRWPDAARRIAAAAARLREESDVLDQLATTALAMAQRVDPAVLAIDELRRLAPALVRRVLGRWLDALGLPRPPARVWPRVLPELIDARADATPMLAWRGAELRRYRDGLYAMAPLAPADASWALAWNGETSLSLPAGFGRLALEPATPIVNLMVRPRRGGERLQQGGAHRELRTLLQDLGIPPWVRERLPLLFVEGELVAAGDLALAPAFAQSLRDRGSRLRWYSG